MSFTNYEFPNVSNYDSDLRELLKLFKELYDNYDSIYTQFNEIVAQFAEFQRIIDALPNTIDTKVRESVEAQMAIIQAEIDAQFASMTARIDALQALTYGFNDLVNETREYNENYTDNAVAVLNADVLNYRAQIYTRIAQIEAEIEALQWELPDIYNIAKGENTSIVECIYDCYDAVRVHALTALECDSANLTASAYDALEINAIDFDTIGNWKIYGKPCEYVINPYTAQRDTLQNVLWEIARADIQPVPITASEYDTLELTADNYDTREITAYNFDFFAKQILM